MILSSRFIRFSNTGNKEVDDKINKEKFQPIADYLDAGKPIIGIRTANHGFRFRLPYLWKEKDKAEKNLNFGVHVLGGTFAGHYGGWHREATQGIVKEGKGNHAILTGVKSEDIFGSIIYGPQFKSTRMRYSSIYKLADEFNSNMGLTNTIFQPRLRLNRNCSWCRFYNDCKQKARSDWAQAKLPSQTLVLANIQ